MPVVLYAVLSLTVIRMLPVFLCLLGTPVGTGEKLFIGWFGPRGLASIVFAIMVFDAQLPGNDTLMATVALHGAAERGRARDHGEPADAGADRSAGGPGCPAGRTGCGGWARGREWGRWPVILHDGAGGG